MATLQDLNLTPNLYRNPSSNLLDSIGVVETFSATTNSDSVDSGESINTVSMTDGLLQSANFVSGSTGWRIDADGNLEANDGNFRGDLTGATGTFSGSLVAGSIHIPDIDTTANSFHTNATGNSWWGATQTDFNADNDNATAYILNTGVAKFKQVSLTSNVIISGLQAGSALAVEYLSAGTISSKAILLGVTGGTGDSYIAGGNNLDLANWRGGDANGGAIILGLDDSDDDKGKFFAGNYSTTQYIQYDGDEFFLNGISLDEVVRGATASTNFGIFTGSDVDGFTETETYSGVVTRRPLNTQLTVGVNSSSSSLAGLTSGVIGFDANFQDNYNFFLRTKSLAGQMYSSSQGGVAYYFGLIEDGGTAPNGKGLGEGTNINNSRGRSIPGSHIGFIVDWDDTLWATSGSGLSDTGNYCSSQDITELTGITHTNYNNYKIETSYASFPARSNTGFTLPTDNGTTSFANPTNAYDGDSGTFAQLVGSNVGGDSIMLSWDGGTTYTRAIPTTVSGTTPTNYSLGGEYETWGRTWSVSEFTNANFLVKLDAISASGNYADLGASAFPFIDFDWDTSTWENITGIEIALRAAKGSSGCEVYEITVKVYFTTTANTGYNKFYVNDILVATHTTSIPRSTEAPVMHYMANNGLYNSTQYYSYLYNNYKLEIT